MKKRQSTIQKFSTFLSFSGANRNSSHQWIVEPKLERGIQQQAQASPEKTAEQWAIHFLKILLSETTTTQPHFASRNLALGKHLSAYLQEACFYAAQKVMRQFRSIQHKYELEDLFQIGNVVVNQPTKLFRSFNVEHQNNCLEGYAKTAVFRFIGNVIYAQDIEAKREKFSDYGLLRDLSNKELKEALASSGISAIDSYCLARHCFNAVCQPQTRRSNRSLEAPSEEDLIQITVCYNQQDDQLNLSTGLANTREIQLMLSTCIQAARTYRTQMVLALENDDAISDPMPTPLDTVIQIEEQSQIESLVSQSFTTIAQTGQTLLKLWLGLNLTQTEIAIVLQQQYPELQKQYQVARHLAKHNRSLLKTFLQQCQQLNPELCLNHEKAIVLIQKSLDECLKTYCQNWVSACLDRFARQHCTECELLWLADLSKSEYLLDPRSINRKRSFIQAVERHLEKDLNVSPESLNCVDPKIVNAVDQWLIGFAHSPVQARR